MAASDKEKPDFLIVPDEEPVFKVKAGRCWRFQLEPRGELWLRIDIDPDDVASWDDRFKLFSSDSSYCQTKTVKDDQIAGDEYVDLYFTCMDETLRYSLEVDSGEGDTCLVFEDLPYAEIFELSSKLDAE